VGEAADGAQRPQQALAGLFFLGGILTGHGAPL
jgi:hypothetical protein